MNSDVVVGIITESCVRALECNERASARFLRRRKRLSVAEFLQNNSMLIFMAIILVGMMWFTSRSRKRMQQQQEEREREIAEKMVPGVWVHTAVGFWGRFVDADGEVIVLETSDGTEMYWDRKMIREVGENPPFASELNAAESEDHEDEESVLGLSDPSENHTDSSSETNENSQN